MRVSLSRDERFLHASFDAAQRTLSWALVGGGFGVHTGVVWHFVTRAELGPDVDARELLVGRLRAQGHERVVGMLTARHLRPYAEAAVEHDAASARAVVTVGLSNALRAGDPPAPSPRVGTINLLCWVNVPLSDEAMLEALALSAEARTAALLEAGVPSVVSELPATGTGTDCIVIACPLAGEKRPYAGKHTAVGAAVGKSVLEATQSAIAGWLCEQERASEERRDGRRD